MSGVFFTNEAVGGRSSFLAFAAFVYICKFFVKNKLIKKKNKKTKNKASEVSEISFFKKSTYTKDSCLKISLYCVKILCNWKLLHSKGQLPGRSVFLLCVHEMKWEEEDGPGRGEKIPADCWQFCCLPVSAQESWRKVARNQLCQSKKVQGQ